MKATPSEVLRQRAAAATLRRMAEDRSRAHHRVKPLLTYLEENLFDPDLSIQRLLRDCGLRDKGVLTRFHADLGRSPWAYAVDRRMEVAARLLAETDLKVWKIAHLTGYESTTTFGRAFRKRLLLRPTQYRIRQRAKLPLPEPAPEPAGSAEATDDSLDALFRDLRSLQARLTGEPRVDPALPITISGEQFEHAVAERVWETLRLLDRPAQKRLVAEQLRFTTPALFHLLREKSRSEGRKDRQLGGQLAQLALYCLGGIESGHSQEEASLLRARGWSQLGRSCRLALDYRAAEAAFRRAGVELGSSEEPSVRAELQINQAGLHWVQRQYEQALELADSALPLLRNHAAPREVVEALILRSNIQRYARDPQTAFDDLLEAKQLCDEAAPSRLLAVLFSSQTKLYLLTGDLAAARSCCLEAAALFEQLNDASASAHFCWLQGHLLMELKDFSSAADALRSARQQFIELDRVDAVAVCCLDLAFVCSRLGCDVEAQKNLSEALPILEAYQRSTEIFSALRLLRQLR